MSKPLVLECHRCGAEITTRDGRHFTDDDYRELLRQFLELQTTGRWTEEYARMNAERSIELVQGAHTIRPIARLERALQRAQAELDSANWLLKHLDPFLPSWLQNPEHRASEPELYAALQGVAPPPDTLPPVEEAEGDPFAIQTQ